MTSGFDSPQLLVGEVHAVRTFDLRADGRLWPVTQTGASPWVDGPNHAVCQTCDPAGGNGCACGFWAYGWSAALLEQPSSANVAGVVSCWGRITPGTRGIRAENATIDALWLSRRVTDRLVERVVKNYPHTRIYRSRRAMLLAHPPTVLPGYHRRQPLRAFTRWLPRLLMTASALVAFAVGSLPIASLNDLLRPHPTLTTMVAVGIESSILTGLVLVFVASGMYASNRATAARVMLRMASRFAAYGLWAVAPLLVTPAALVARSALVWLVTRQLLNRAVLFIPRGNRASIAINNAATAAVKQLFDQRK